MSSTLIVGVTQSQLNGRHCLEHSASPVPQSYTSQLGDSGNIKRFFYQHTNRAVAIYSMKGDDSSVKNDLLPNLKGKKLEELRGSS